ncbi:hypothetical protein VFPPC_13013 [Pochonia chlamydosporia 170]|uniref:Uncharacterized protein n=1 Tax=Pochonia chlamydosporia 170 TaxID=1380566 RepID=A0A179G6M7_METCM|nr:hypothetical protein VFPPC_13013 [Pochonia chlamydosporia 170]OAQ73452.1 hypothetical protein VFPPC_13013 [Pochonia chlamydosporia 170]
MKAVALCLLVISTVAQAGPVGHDGSGRPVVRRSGLDNGLGSLLRLNSGASDGQDATNEIKNTPRDFYTIVGEDGAVNTANAQLLSIDVPTGRVQQAGTGTTGQQNSRGGQRAQSNQKGKGGGKHQNGQKTKGKKGQNGHHNRNGKKGQKGQYSQQPGRATATTPRPEGFRLSLVTVTVQATGQPANTVTRTVTASCNQNNSQQPNPTTNANGNGVGVSTIPIDKSALPTTTFSSNPQAAPPVTVQKPSSSPSVSPSSSSSSSSSSPSSSSQTATLNGPIAPLPLTSASSTSSAPLTSSLQLGGLNPTATPVLDSAVAPGPTTPAVGVVAPAQPVINLSGLTLNSVLDLGNLAGQKGQVRASPTRAF